MSRFLRGLLAVVLLLLGRRRRRETGDAPSEQTPRSEEVAVVLERELPSTPRSELVVAVFLLLAGACAVAFVVVYMTLGARHATQWLGLAIGLGFAFLAVALIVAGKLVVPQEVAVEERAELHRPQEAREVAAELRGGADGISRRKLLAGAAGVAGAGIGVAIVAPAASLGPNVSQRIDDSPWHAGSRVVDEHGAPILADDVVRGTFLTGFPDGASLRDVAAPVVIVRLAPEVLHLPAGRDPARWAPEGILAYSKICTHAGCPIALYRRPLYPATEPRPALVCPCHYSTFDPARGAQRIFGPAGRPLPQLPLAIDPATRELRANGGYSGSVGPAWLNVKRGGA
jgi:ubiquinol-cytochrome c reductase iron-sulfur subunit